MRAALWRHLQWRGVTLAGLGALWVWYGIGLIVADRPGVATATAPLLRLMCMEAWGGVWIACGLAGLATAVVRTGRDVAGFGALAGPPLAWGAAFLAAAATGAVDTAWASVPLFIAPLFLVVVIACITGGRTRERAGEGVADGR